ncbi:hypothetical protein [Bdellovibrio bacteriovorus]|uniref:hypothetical protein n=1 Tax=Bdellovibrio TaxID=958 RepID=UPI0035A97565
MNYWKWIAVFLSLFFAIASQASSPRKQIEEKIVADLAQSLGGIKTPEEALAKYKSHLSAQEIAYLEELISKKLWVEIPSVSGDKTNINMKFSNGTTLELQVVDYWKGEFALGDYKLEMDKYPRIEDRMNYLRRVIQSKVLKKESRGAWLFSLIFPSAHASLTCNALVSSGCMEVSMAASLWLARTASDESPLRRCTENYYLNKNQDATKACMKQFMNSPTITSIQELSEVLVMAPDMSVELACNKGDGPDIWINGSQVTRLGKGTAASDYSISMAQDPKMKLTKIPDLAIRCCRKSSGDALAGQCEEFVNNHLGSREKRKQEFKDSNLRVRGKSVEGIK